MKGSAVSEASHRFGPAESALCQFRGGGGYGPRLRLDIRPEPDLSARAGPNLPPGATASVTVTFKLARERTASSRLITGKSGDLWHASSHWRQVPSLRHWPHAAGRAHSDCSQSPPVSHGGVTGTGKAQGHGATSRESESKSESCRLTGTAGMFTAGSDDYHRQQLTWLGIQWLMLEVEVDCQTVPVMNETSLPAGSWAGQGARNIWHIYLHHLEKRYRGQVRITVKPWISRHRFRRMGWPRTSCDKMSRLAYHCTLDKLYKPG